MSERDSICASAEKPAAEIEFRPIAGFPGYMAGSDGFVWTFTNWRGRGPSRKKGHYDSHGYLKVEFGLKKQCKKLVHRVICEAFHGPAVNRQHQVRHLNGIKTDNRPENLAWGTAKENAADRDMHGTTAAGERHGMSKLTDRQRDAIREFAAVGMPTTYMAAYLKVSASTIQEVIYGDR